MRLTAAACYAVHALAYMDQLGEGRPVASHDIARAKGIPEKYLLKALLPLVRARVLESLRGPNGGYRLAMPAKGISLLEVVDALEGPICGDVSVEGPGELDERLQALCDQVAEMTRGRLRKVMLSDLPGKGGRRRKP